MKAVIDNIYKPNEIPEYAWMINTTPQHEWIDDKGVFLWLAFFFSEIGAGLYFFAMLFDYTPGMVLGWLLTLLVGGGVHMAYLGNPKRFWRIFAKPLTSELSRGVWVIMIFAALGFLQVIFGGGVFFKVVMGFISILLVMHGFATMNVMKSVPSWSSTTILPLSIISGIWVGSQICQFIMGFSGGNIAAVEVWSIVLFISYISALFLYLWSTSHVSETAKFSVYEIIRGSLSNIFILAVVFLGIILPLIITVKMNMSGVSAWWIFTRLILVFIGDVMMRYSLMKSGYYTPLI